MKTATINSREVSFEVEIEDFSAYAGAGEYDQDFDSEAGEHDQGFDVRVKLSVGTESFCILFQQGILGHVAELGMQQEYRALFVALGGKAEDVEESCDRFDWAIRNLDGWHEFEKLVHTEVNN